MEAIKVYYNGRVFIPIEPIDVHVNQSLMITVVDYLDYECDDNNLSDKSSISPEMKEMIKKLIPFNGKM